MRPRISAGSSIPTLNHNPTPLTPPNHPAPPVSQPPWPFGLNPSLGVTKKCNSQGGGGSGWEGVDEGGSVASEGLEDVSPLFSRRSDDGAERGEVLSGVESPESAGDFHLHLHHAQRLLGEVVGERDVEVDEEAQDVVFELMQPAQEVLPRPSLGLARGGLREAGQLAVESKPFAQGL